MILVNFGDKDLPVAFEDIAQNVQFYSKGADVNFTQNTIGVLMGDVAPYTPILLVSYPIYDDSTVDFGEQNLTLASVLTFELSTGEFLEIPVTWEGYQPWVSGGKLLTAIYNFPVWINSEKPAIELAIFSYLTCDNDDITCDNDDITCDDEGTPAMIPGLVLYLDASRLNLANDADVTVWDDHSSHGHDFIEVDSLMNPTYKLNQINGLPALDYVLSSLKVADNHIRNTQFDCVAGQEFTIFMIAKVVTPPSGWGVIFAKSGGIGAAATYTFGRRSGDGAFGVILRGNNVDNFTAGNDNFNLFSMRWDQTTHSFRMNRAEISGMSNINVAANQDFPVYIGGANQPNNRPTGQIAEVIVFDRALTNAERERIENYLYTKYYE